MYFLAMLLNVQLQIRCSSLRQIGRGSAQNWPSWSLDLNPSD